jgi:hypothetical protein
MSRCPIARPVASSVLPRRSCSVGMDGPPVEPTVLHYVHATPVDQARPASSWSLKRARRSSRHHGLEINVPRGSRPIGSGSVLDRTPLHLIPLAPTVSMGYQGGAS